MCIFVLPKQGLLSLQQLPQTTISEMLCADSLQSVESSMEALKSIVWSGALAAVKREVVCTLVNLETTLCMPIARQ